MRGKKIKGTEKAGYRPPEIRKGDIVRKCRGFSRATPRTHSQPPRLVRFASNCNIFTPGAQSTLMQSYLATLCLALEDSDDGASGVLVLMHGKEKSRRVRKGCLFVSGLLHLL